MLQIVEVLHSHQEIKSPLYQDFALTLSSLDLTLTLFSIRSFVVLFLPRNYVYKYPDNVVGSCNMLRYPKPRNQVT